MWWSTVGTVGIKVVGSDLWEGNELPACGRVLWAVALTWWAARGSPHPYTSGRKPPNI